MNNYILRFDIMIIDSKYLNIQKYYINNFV